MFLDSGHLVEVMVAKMLLKVWWWCSCWCYGCWLCGEDMGVGCVGEG